MYHPKQKRSSQNDPSAAGARAAQEPHNKTVAAQAAPALQLQSSGAPIQRGRVKEGFKKMGRGVRRLFGGNRGGGAAPPANDQGGDDYERMRMHMQGQLGNAINTANQDLANVGNPDAAPSDDEFAERLDRLEHQGIPHQEAVDLAGLPRNQYLHAARMRMGWRPQGFAPIHPSQIDDYRPTKSLPDIPQEEEDN